MRLSLQAQIRLERRTHIRRQKAVHPVEFPGKIAARPAQHLDAQILHGFHHIAAHSVKVILGQQRNGSYADITRILPADSQVGIRVSGLRGELHLQTGPIVAATYRCGTAVDVLSGPICQ